MTPIMRSEPEPIVVHVKETPQPDIIARTNWVYSFSAWLIVLGVAAGLLLDLLISNNNEEERKENLEESDEIVEGLQFLRLLPLKLIAQKMQEYAKDENNPNLHKRIEQYIRKYGVFTQEMEKDISEYKTFEEFFTRNLNEVDLISSYAAFVPLENIDVPELRDRLDSVFSPVQGTIVNIQKITSELHKEYIKDEWYSAKQFLGFNPFEEAKRIKEQRIAQLEKNGIKVTQIPKKDMYMCVIYLAPGDYHRFHSPVAWNIKKRSYYSGNYYPVYPSYYNFFNFKSLLGTNERVVLSGEWKHGFFAFVPVGATNVGSIHLTTEPDFDNVALTVDREEVTYDSQNVAVGNELGHFSLGSTVVLVFEYDGSVNMKPGTKIRVGDPLFVRRKDYLLNTSETVQNLPFVAIEYESNVRQQKLNLFFANGGEVPYSSYASRDPVFDDELDDRKYTPKGFPEEVVEETKNVEQDALDIEDTTTPEEVVPSREEIIEKLKNKREEIEKEFDDSEFFIRYHPLMSKVSKGKLLEDLLSLIPNRPLPYYNSYIDPNSQARIHIPFYKRISGKIEEVKVSPEEEYDIVWGKFREHFLANHSEEFKEGDDLAIECLQNDQLKERLNNIGEKYANNQLKYTSFALAPLIDGGINYPWYLDGVDVDVDPLNILYQDMLSLGHIELPETEQYFKDLKFKIQTGDVQPDDNYNEETIDTLLNNLQKAKANRIARENEAN